MSETESIGSVINKLSCEPAPIQIRLKGRAFDMLVHPYGEGFMLEFARFLDDKRKEAGELSAEEKDRLAERWLVAFAAARQFRTAKGRPIWESPEDVQAKGAAWAQIRAAVYEHVLGISLAEISVQNFQDSR